MGRFVAFMIALGLLIPHIATAEDLAALTRQTLESGHLADGEKAISAQLAARPTDNEARFGLGMIRFAQAIEGFAQRQYRYVAHAPHGEMIPFLRLPVPFNPKPEEISYEKQRENLQALLNDLANVDATLEPMTSDATKIVIDLNAVKIDFRGDGAPGKADTLGAIIAALQQHGAAPSPSANPTFEVKFDNSDALWLRGYCHLLSAALEFVLAYDWRTSFEHAGHLFYSRVAARPFGQSVPLPVFEGEIFGNAGEAADLLVLIHDIRWPLMDASRMGKVHAHLKQVVALSRASWKSILAETSDDREWIPGPKQNNGVISSMPVTQEQVDAWFRALDDFDALLDGAKLLPHWRFAEGFNLRRFFMEPRDFDLVLLAAGYGAAPYLEKGPKVTADEWRKLNGAFRGNLIGYAFWFN